MNDEVEESNLKSRLLMRIVIAVALIVAAVVILTLVQHFSSTEEAPQKTAPPVAPKPLPKPPPVLAPPLPVTPASGPVPQPVSAPQPAEPAPASAPQAVTPPIEPAVTEAPQAVTPPVVETPPPPAVSNVAPGVKSSAKRHERRQQEKKREKKSQNIGKAGKASIEGVYALQFGVFSSESNSGKMAAMLKEKGLKPLIDVRVLAGPYPDKESAEKDRKKLGGILVPLAKGYALQVGDFQSMQHAEALSGKLKGQKVPVLVQTRIRAGRYASRKAALDAAKKAGIAAIAVKL